MLRFGPDEGPIAIMALPLFEEANRTQAFAVAICRALAARGVASVLPDLPGQGESVVRLETVTLSALRTAHASLVDRLWAGHRHTYALGVRSGALLDLDSRVYGRWRFSPQEGQALLRELTRVRHAAPDKRLKVRDDWFLDLVDENGSDIPVEIAGNVISPALLSELYEFSPARSASLPVRSVRLESDASPADRHVAGSPLWRRSEPGNDLPLAQMLADDIAEWIATCEG